MSDEITQLKEILRQFGEELRQALHDVETGLGENSRNKVIMALAKANTATQRLAKL
jgi:hypothetical protein